jgi:hypothetical protein
MAALRVEAQPGNMTVATIREHRRTSLIEAPPNRRDTSRDSFAVR